MSTGGNAAKNTNGRFSATNNGKAGRKPPPVGKRFQKGKSGNPRGRPKKDIAFVQLVQDYLAERDPATKQTRALSLIHTLYQHALKGNMFAVKELLDRGYGKPTQPIEIDTAALRSELERLAEETGRPVEEIEREAERQGAPLLRVVGR